MSTAPDDPASLGDILEMGGPLR